MKPNLLKNWIKEQIRLFRFNLSASNNPLFIGYYRYVYRPDPNTVSAFLDAYSRSLKHELYVVQVGANDGITHDPIHKFIKRDKWKGVLLEPQPFVHKNFLSRIYARNPGIHTLCAAIGEEDSTLPLYKIAFSTMRWATGLASFDNENVLKAFENGLVQKQCEKYGIKIPDSKADWIASEVVEVISPATLVQRYGIKRIDLLQIDCEGYDTEVIRIFDIAKTQPQVIIFENSHVESESGKSCNRLLAENDYVTKQFGPNTLAIKRTLDHSPWSRLLRSSGGYLTSS